MKIRKGDYFIWQGSDCGQFLIVGQKYRITNVELSESQTDDGPIDYDIYFNDSMGREDCIFESFFGRGITKHISMGKINPNFSRYTKMEKTIWEQ